MIKSSIVKSSWEAVISVRRSSPNCSLTSTNSWRITCINRSGEARISSNSLIIFNNSSNSLIILSCSNAVKRCNLNSRIAWACAGDKVYPFSPIPYSDGKSSGREALDPACSSIAFTRPSCQVCANKASFASCGVDERLMISIISSILASAIPSPSNKWALARAFFNSNMVRRVTTSRRCLIKYTKISFIFKVRG